MAKFKYKRKGNKYYKKRKMTRIPKRVNNLTAQVTVKYRAWTALITTSPAAGPAPDAGISIPLNAVGFYASANYTTPTTSNFALLPNVPSVATLQNLYTTFDQFKVLNLNVQLITRYVDNGSSQTEADMQCVYHYNDPDDMVVSTQQLMDDRAVDPQPVNQGAVGKKFHSFNFRQPKAERHIWYNTTNASIGPATATFSTEILSPTYFKSMKLLQPSPFSAVINTPNYFGRLVCTWTVTFRSLV